MEGYTNLDKKHLRTRAYELNMWYADALNIGLQELLVRKVSIFLIFELYFLQIHVSFPDLWLAGSNI
jgi:hypothetical protein